MSSTVIGIDLGTATITAALVVDGRQEIVARMPAAVARGGESWLVGDHALRAAAAGRAEAVGHLLQLLGRKIGDFTTHTMPRWSVPLVQGLAGKALVEFRSPRLRRRAYTPEELVGILFAAIRQVAEIRVQRRIHDAVLTVPAAFNRTQRHCLRTAARMAGLNPIKLLVSASAVGLAHAQTLSERPLMLVVDCGAGSTDVSLLMMQTSERAEVKAVAGTNEVGAEAFTERLMHSLLGVRAINGGVGGVGPSSSSKFLLRLRRACQLAMRLLSTSTLAAIELEPLAGESRFQGVVTRSQFEYSCKDLWERFLEPLRHVLDDADVTKEEVPYVILCGGAAAVPRLQAAMRAYFGEDKPLVIVGDHDLAAQGAAWLGSMLARAKNSLLPVTPLRDVTPFDVGLQRLGMHDVSVLIRRNMRLPTTRQQVLFAISSPELTYRLVEAPNLRPRPAEPSGTPPTTLSAHPLAILRVEASGGHAQLVVKLEATIELSEADELVVTLSSVHSGAARTTTIVGDDSVLSVETTERARDELEGIFGAHRATWAAPLEATLRPPMPHGQHPAANGLGNGHTVDDAFDRSLDALREYALMLRRMLATNRLEVSISREDKRVLADKIEAALVWLEAQDAAPTTLDGQPVEGEATSALIQRHLQTLRRLHFSIAATSALAALRDSDVDGQSF